MFTRQIRRLYMKVGIVSINKYVQEINCGSMLQAFALQRFIQSLGHEAELVDYFPRYRIGINTHRPYLSRSVGKRERVLYANNFWELRKRWRDFRDFCARYLTFSKLRYSYDNFQTNDYDCYVIGSDTVWNVPQTRFEPAYYGEFDCMKRCVAYAASFGDSIYDEKDRARFRQCLKKFSAVSIREKTNMEAFDQAWREKVEVVCDPTFLLDKKVYDEIAVSPMRRGKYLLLYMVYQNNPLIRKRVDGYAKKHGLEVIEISLFKKNLVVRALSSVANICGYGHRASELSVDNLIPHLMRYDAGIGEWLGLIREADMVVTNSFHASVFSILFKRNFCNFSRRGGGVKVRFLCEKLGIAGRHLGEDAEIPETRIDYAEVSDRLSGWRDESARFLSRALRG